MQQTTEINTKEFEVTFVDNKTGAKKELPAFAETIEEALKKALRVAGTWNYTIINIGQVNA